MTDFCELQDLLKPVSKRLTSADVAYILNIHLGAVDDLIATGDLPCFSGIIYKSDLIDYLIKNESANLPILDD